MEIDDNNWDGYLQLLEVVFHNKDRRHGPPQGSKGHPAWNKRYDYCTIEGCGNRHRAKGMCISHYSRKRRLLNFN